MKEPNSEEFNEWLEAVQMARVDGFDAGASASLKWECMGRKQSLPEPGECDWPGCGCDPQATKVIDALIEQGWRAEANLRCVLKQHAKDLRCACSGGDGSEPDWHAAKVLDYVADNLREIAAHQPRPTPLDKPRGLRN